MKAIFDEIAHVMESVHDFAREHIWCSAWRTLLMLFLFQVVLVYALGVATGQGVWR